MAKSGGQEKSWIYGADTVKERGAADVRGDAETLPGHTFAPSVERYRHGESGERYSDLVTLEIAVDRAAMRLEVVAAAIKTLDNSAAGGVACGSVAILGEVANALSDIATALSDID